MGPVQCLVDTACVRTFDPSISSPHIMSEGYVDGQRKEKPVFIVFRFDLLCLIVSDRHCKFNQTYLFTKYMNNRNFSTRICKVKSGSKKVLPLITLFTNLTDGW